LTPALRAGDDPARHARRRGPLASLAAARRLLRRFPAPRARGSQQRGAAAAGGQAAGPGGALTSTGPSRWRRQDLRHERCVTQPSGGRSGDQRVCTHMSASWTNADRTIDCPCHGSKFSITDGPSSLGRPQPLPRIPEDPAAGSHWPDGTSRRQSGGEAVLSVESGKGGDGGSRSRGAGDPRLHRARARRAAGRAGIEPTRAPARRAGAGAAIIRGRRPRRDRAVVVGHPP